MRSLGIARASIVGLARSSRTTSHLGGLGASKARKVGLSTPHPRLCFINEFFIVSLGVLAPRSKRPQSSRASSWGDEDALATVSLLCFTALPSVLGYCLQLLCPIRACSDAGGYKKPEWRVLRGNRWDKKQSVSCAMFR